MWFFPLLGGRRSRRVELSKGASSSSSASSASPSAAAAAAAAAALSTFSPSPLGPASPLHARVLSPGYEGPPWAVGPPGPPQGPGGAPQGTRGAPQGPQVPRGAPQGTRGGAPPQGTLPGTRGGAPQGTRGGAPQGPPGAPRGLQAAGSPMGRRAIGSPGAPGAPGAPLHSGGGPLGRGYSMGPHNMPPRLGWVYKEDAAVAAAAGEIYAYVASLPAACTSSKLGPGLVCTSTSGKLFVGSLLNALNEELLLSLKISVLFSVAWPFGSWVQRQSLLCNKLRILRVFHALIDDPSQVSTPF